MHKNLQISRLLRYLLTITYAVILFCTISAVGAPINCSLSFRSVGAASYDVNYHFFKKENQLGFKEQIAVDNAAKAAEEFLRQFDNAVAGQKDIPFGVTGIEIRPISEAPNKREFSVQDGKIILGLKKNLLGIGSYKTHTPQSIRDMWERGDQFENTDRMKKLWLFINPIGTFRSSMRNQIKNLREHAKNRIQSSRVSDLKEIAKGKLDQWADNDVEALRSSWVKSVNSNEAVEDVLNAAMEKIVRDRMPNYDLKLSSHFINVGNIHDIDIGVRTGVGELVGDTERPSIKVESRGGFVNVFTIDRVHVNVDFSNSLEKAALLRALASVRGNH